MYFKCKCELLQVCMCECVHMLIPVAKTQDFVIRAIQVLVLSLGDTVILTDSKRHTGCLCHVPFQEGTCGSESR